MFPLYLDTLRYDLIRGVTGIHFYHKTRTSNGAYRKFRLDAPDPEHD